MRPEGRDQAAAILAALGGVDNIDEIEPCTTRLRSLVRDARPSYLPSASPFNRLVVRAESDQLVTVAARLADLERPVAARGVVLLDRLLTDGSGPLYDRDRQDEFGRTLDLILDAVEPR